jgi:hypothetical protein
MAKTKAQLLEEAAAKGVELPAGLKKAEIEAIVEEAAPPVEEPVVLPDDAPDSVKESEALSTPETPLAHTPAEPLTEYGDRKPNPPVEAPSVDPGHDDDIGVQLPGTPA